MSEDKKFKVLLDQQIGIWLMKREKTHEEERRMEGHRVSMECVNAPKKFKENLDAA